MTYGEFCQGVIARLQKANESTDIFEDFSQGLGAALKSEGNDENEDINNLRFTRSDIETFDHFLYIALQGEGLSIIESPNAADALRNINAIYKACQEELTAHFGHFGPVRREIFQVVEPLLPENSDAQEL